MKKPKIFIASSVESLHVADALNVNFDHHAEVTVWKHGFELSQNSIKSLITSAMETDFAIFVFTPDDAATIRGTKKLTVRDNVLFELGLFIGTLGIERCFIIKPRDTELHLPSDLLGLTPTDYEGKRADGNLEAAVNSPSTLIKKKVSRLGLISDGSAKQKKSRKTINYDIELGYVEHHVLVESLEAHYNSPDGENHWSITQRLSQQGIDKKYINMGMIKLERMGYLDRKICNHDNNETYYSLTITSDGINYLLDNEKIVQESTDIPFDTLESTEINGLKPSLDDDIPF